MSRDPARDLARLLRELVNDYDAGLGLLEADDRGMMAAFEVTDEDGNVMTVEVSCE